MYVIPPDVCILKEQQFESELALVALESISVQVSGTTGTLNYMTSSLYENIVNTWLINLVVNKMCHPWPCPNPRAQIFQCVIKSLLLHIFR